MKKIVTIGLVVLLHFSFESLALQGGEEVSMQVTRILRPLCWTFRSGTS